MVHTRDMEETTDKMKHTEQTKDKLECSTSTSSSLEHTDDTEHKQTVTSPTDGEGSKSKSKQTLQKKPDPDPERCQYYVNRKRRYCRTRPFYDGIYCAHHAYESNDKERKVRL